MAVPISPSGIRAFKDLLRKALRDGFNPGTFTPSPPQGFPDLIAGPPTGRPLADFQRSAGRKVCDRWARGERPEIFPHRDVYYRDMCNPYLGGGTPGQPTTAPPFSGGQCGGVAYNIFLTQNNTSTGVRNPEQLRGSLFGPLTQTTVTPAPDFCGDAVATPEVFIHTAGTDPRSGVPLFNAGGGSCTLFPWDTAVRIARSDGAPDTCGDPPPEFDPGEPNPTPEPNPGPIPGPPGYPFPNIDIDINPDGTINIDFGDGEPPDTIDPTVEPPLPPVDPGPPPGDVGDPGPPGDTGAGGETDGEAPEGSVLSALKINILATPPRPKEYAPGVFRGVCYAYLGTADGLDHDPAGAMLRDGQIIFPELENLTHWAVRANSGYNLRVTPYYRVLEPTE